MALINGLEKLFTEAGLSPTARLARLQQSLSPANSSLPSERSNNASVVQLGDTPSLRELEKHINDYEAGEGQLSQHTYSKISLRDSSTHDLLSLSNPRGLEMYSAYMTAGFGYGTQAIFVSNVNRVTEATARIVALSDTVA